MTRRRALIGILAAASAFAPIAACGRFDPDDAREIVDRIGAGRIRDAALELRGASPGQVPPERWPDALRELEPQAVYVSKDGVRVAKYGFFVEGEGIYVLFPGSPPPKPDSADPWFRRIEERIYWYRVTG